jgi:hypothetical protein
MEEEFKKLLEMNWEESERDMIKRIMDGLLYYKKLLPRTLKNDVAAALELCNKLKDELEALREKVIEDKKKNEEDTDDKE